MPSSMSFRTGMGLSSPGSEEKTKKWICGTARLWCEFDEMSQRTQLRLLCRSRHESPEDGLLLESVGESEHYLCDEFRDGWSTPPGSEYEFSMRLRSLVQCVRLREINRNWRFSLSSSRSLARERCYPGAQRLCRNPESNSSGTTSRSAESDIADQPRKKSKLLPGPGRHNYSQKFQLVVTMRIDGCRTSPNSRFDFWRIPSWQEKSKDYLRNGWQRTGNLALVMRVMGQTSTKAAMQYQYPDLDHVRNALNLARTKPEQEVRVN